MNKSAFSLVELSIVLVILGLLTGGILGGQALMRASELRSITTDYHRYKTAVMTFRDKYFALPGDMLKAQDFWGINPNCATGTAGAGTQTCNGNGDGIVDVRSTGNRMEQFLIWQHLANAGMINGTYSGGHPSDQYRCEANLNCPTAKINSAFIYMATFWLGTGNAGTNGWWWYEPNLRIMFGKHTGATNYPGYGIFTPAEAWNIDLKMDDGKPAMGKVRSFGGPTAAYTINCAINSTTGAALTAAEGTKALAPNAAYALTRESNDCSLEFVVD